MTPQQLLARLPKSRHLLKSDLGAAGCFAMLVHGDDPIAVIDELLAYYAALISDLRKVNSDDVVACTFISNKDAPMIEGRSDTIIHA